MTTEEKFNAAVNVIKNLPKNGSYQPSNELMLKFYSYFKQATEGPCKSPKPAFWEIVNKAKWQAWTKLGNMDRLEAMNNYVEELKKIVETMSFTENVANFVGSLDSFYESVPIEDLELVVGSALPDHICPRRNLPSDSVEESKEAFPNKKLRTHSCSDSFDVIPENIIDNTLYNTKSMPYGEYEDSPKHIITNNNQQLNRNYQIHEQNLNQKNMSQDDNVIVYETDLNLRAIDRILLTLKCLENDAEQIIIRLNSMEKNAVIFNGSLIRK